MFLEQMNLISNNMKALITSCLAAILFVSCQTNTLQTFLVDAKEDDNFISVDFSLKTFVDNFDQLPEDQKEVFKDVSKVNFLGFKKDSANDEDYKSKQQELTSILSSEYNDTQLMSVNSENSQMSMYADNIEGTVEEIIIYANDTEQGFMVVRLLGDDLNPSNFYKLMKMSDGMNFDSLSELINVN